MIKWLRKFFKRKDNNFFNCHHPNFTGQIEPAFESLGTQYYRFSKETSLPYSRYQLIQTYLLEYDLRMNYSAFKAFLTQLKGFMDGSKGQINLGKAFETLSKMEARAELAFNPDQVYNLASVIYFDQDEDIHRYDFAYNKKKVARWKEANETAFFFTKPMDELLGLNGFSKEDLQIFIRQSEEILNALTSETPEA